MLLELEVYRHLFRDNASLEAFAEVLVKATKEDDTPMVTYNHRHISTVLSPKATDRMLSDRILQRFVEKPELLNTFVERLQNLKAEDIVD